MCDMSRKLKKKNISGLLVRHIYTHRESSSEKSGNGTGASAESLEASEQTLWPQKLDSADWTGSEKQTQPQQYVNPKTGQMQQRG